MLLYEPFGVAIRSTLLSIVSYTFHRPDKRYDFIPCRKHYYSVVVQFIRVTNDLIPYREAGNVAL